MQSRQTAPITTSSVYTSPATPILARTDSAKRAFDAMRDLGASGESMAASVNQTAPSEAVGIPAIFAYGLERTVSQEKKLLMSHKVGGCSSVR
ncbi:MAG: hypothetical protein QXH35_05155 [Nitrososphaerota archaeon]